MLHGDSLSIVAPQFADVAEHDAHRPVKNGRDALSPHELGHDGREESRLIAARHALKQQFGARRRRVWRLRQSGGQFAQAQNVRANNGQPGFANKPDCGRKSNAAMPAGGMACLLFQDPTRDFLSPNPDS